MLMEKSEPSLVPEWLKSAGSCPGGGISKNQSASSLSDGPLLALPKRGRPSNNDNINDARCSSFQDGSFSTNNRRNSSSSGSTRHDKHYPRSYSNLSRNHRDMEKDSSTVSEHWDPDYPDPLRSIMSGRIEKDTLRRSQSMVPRIQGEPQRASTDLRAGSLNNSGNAHGLSLGVRGAVPRVLFEEDFPSLGSEERPRTPELTRVASPGLSKAGQSFPMVYSAINSGDSWSSALAELPTRISSNSTGSSPPLKPTVPTSESVTANVTGSLNMAEALAQAPGRSPSQPSLQNQRLEELAVIQSKRLIPLTSSVPKSSVHNHSDKLKLRTTPRFGDPFTMMRNGNVRAEGQMTPLTGNIRVLKSGQENGVSPDVKVVASPKANVNIRHVTAQSHSAPSVALPLAKSSLSSKLAGERKAQAQSRSDFFNSVRKKSMNSASVTADSSPVLSSEDHKDLATQTVSQTANSVPIAYKGDASPATRSFVCDEEKELEFLRSMGWEPHSGDDEGLTIEEIEEFLEKLEEMMPTSKRCQVVQLEGTCLKGTSPA